MKGYKYATDSMGRLTEVFVTSKIVESAPQCSFEGFKKAAEKTLGEFTENPSSFKAEDSLEQIEVLGKVLTVFKTAGFQNENAFKKALLSAF